MDIGIGIDVDVDIGSDMVVATTWVSFKGALNGLI